ncbi:hypothetical protein ACFVUS_26410 [Nocardia sp. NPDC058058]|uniref:hypothetical protein n=1 Tax=Nocardia sp. NPDC058058 TaxID=3346317 RepID=UPI0036DCB037
MRPASTAIPLLACAAAVLLAGCENQDTAPAKAAATTTADCTQHGKYPASPTVDLLNGLLTKGLDPNVPNTDKVDLIQGAVGDPGLFNRMLPALQQANFAVVIDNVTDYCNGTANADATLSFSGQTSPAQVPIVAEDGRWKLERTWACGLAASLQQTSPICA